MSVLDTDYIGPKQRLIAIIFSPLIDYLRSRGIFPAFIFLPFFLIYAGFIVWNKRKLGLSLDWYDKFIITLTICYAIICIIVQCIMVMRQ